MNHADNWAEEMQSAYLYRIAAECEQGTPRHALFMELAGEAVRQADIWAKRGREAGTEIPGAYHPDARTWLVARLVRRLGPRALRHVLVAMKVRGMSVYSKPEVMPVGDGHVMPLTVDDVGRRHRGTGGGNLRAAVFGANDGLVSNASLILGVAGASADNGAILLAGIAGLLAGAFSMAAGEYVSVRSQREMYEYQIGLEREELAMYPEEEARELALIYAARGVPKAQALAMARDIVANPAVALDTLAREELGLNPDELGSPWGAAAFSFVSFAAGGVIPLLPYLFTQGNAALLLTVGLTAVGLFGVGAAISLFTGRGALHGGLRMLTIGGLAGGLTYLIGRLLGVSLG